jgi:dTDP-4-dehydrorhamnose reductase
VCLRILIVGGDGIIGGALERKLAVMGHDVAVTTRHRERVTEGTVFLDLARPHVALPPAKYAVICAAMTRFNDCREMPELARQINVTAPVALCADLISRGTRVILLSTSAVFDGRTPHVDASKPPSPRSVYGRLKADAERGVLALGENASVLRLTKVLSRETGILAQWVGELKSGRNIQAFDDHRFCPITLDNALDTIAALIEGGESGIYQVSGSADISFVEAARHLATRIGVPLQRVTAVNAEECGVPADEITPFTSLDTSRLSALTGFVPPQPYVVIDKVFATSLAPACAQ